MRPDVDISKMPVHKARHLEAVDFEKKKRCVRFVAAGDGIW